MESKKRTCSSRRKRRTDQNQAKDSSLGFWGGGENGYGTRRRARGGRERNVERHNWGPVEEGSSEARFITRLNRALCSVQQTAEWSPSFYFWKVRRTRKRKGLASGGGAQWATDRGREKHRESEREEEEKALILERERERGQKRK